MSPGCRCGRSDDARQDAETAALNKLADNDNDTDEKREMLASVGRAVCGNHLWIEDVGRRSFKARTDVQDNMSHAED